MSVEANLKYIRISSKKIRELARLVVGLTPKQAIDKLIVKGNKASQLLIQAIESAKANAINNAKLNEIDLKIVKIEVNRGPFFKRWRAVSRGQAHKIKKYTSHIKVIVDAAKEEKSAKVDEKEIKKSVNAQDDAKLNEKTLESKRK